MCMHVYKSLRICVSMCFRMCVFVSLCACLSVCALSNNIFYTLFRHFRLLQTGPNSSGTFGLFIGGLEFYGVLTENIQKSYFFDQNIADIIL